MTAKPVPEHISNERIEDLEAWALAEEIEAAEDGLPLTAQRYADIACALTELQHRRARGSVVAEGWVTIPIETLQWWRELVDQNPPDLAPRMDRYLKSALGEHP